MNNFIFDQRLQIYIPNLTNEWEHYSKEEQQAIMTEWEIIRSKIPERIKEIEKIIIQKQDLLANELDFDTSCEINETITELAANINELWLWYRS